MTATPDAVEAAARAIDPAAFDPDVTILAWRFLQTQSEARAERQEAARTTARAALAAAAPLIAQQTLLDAAEMLTAKTPDGRRSQAFCAGMDRAALLLRALAATLTPKEN